MFNVNISIEKNKVLGEFIADSYFFDCLSMIMLFNLYKDDEENTS